MGVRGWRLNRKALVIAGFVVAVTATTICLAASHTGAAGDTAVAVRKAKGISMFDVSDKSLLARWADDVFIGRVLGIAGKGALPDTALDAKSPKWPYTLFRVKIEASLKGALRETVVVRQDCGYDSAGALCVLDDDELLQAGHVYLFVTKNVAEDSRSDPLQPAPDCPRVVNRWGDLSVDDLATRAQVIDEFRTAIAETAPVDLSE